MKLSLLLTFTLWGSIGLAAANALPKNSFSPTNLETSTTIAQNSTDPATVNPSSTAPQTEASPLLQAGKQFLSLERYQLESTMEISGDLSGRSFISNAKIETIVAAPNMFSSTFTFVDSDGLAGKIYQIVSDGIKVWIYDQSANQYSVSEIKPFLQTREGFLIGTLSYFYINTRSNLGGSRILGNFVAKLPEAQLLKYFQKFANLDLQNLSIREEEIAGEVYRVYDINSVNKGFQTTAYLDARTGSFVGVDLSGTKNGLQLTSKERVVGQTIPESIPPETFTFSPPEDAEESSGQIAIELF